MIEGIAIQSWKYSSRKAWNQNVQGSRRSASLPRPAAKRVVSESRRLMAVTHWHRQSGNHPVRWKNVQQKIHITEWDHLHLKNSRPTDCMRIQYNILRYILGHWRPFRRCNSASFTLNHNIFFLLWNNSNATLTYMQHLMIRAHWFIHISLITVGFCGFAHFASHYRPLLGSSLQNY